MASARAGEGGAEEAPGAPGRVMKRVGEWIYVEKRDGTWGKVRADRYMRWLEARSGPVTVEDIADAIAEAHRKMRWLLASFGILVTVVAVALLLIMALAG